MFADAIEHSFVEDDASRKSIRIALKHWLCNSMRKGGGNGTGDDNRNISKYSKDRGVVMSLDTGACETNDNYLEDDDDDEISSSGRSLAISTLTLSDSASGSGSTSTSTYDPNSNSASQSLVVSQHGPSTLPNAMANSQEAGEYIPEKLFPSKKRRSSRFRWSMREKLDKIKLSYIDFSQRSTNFPVSFLNSSGSEGSVGGTGDVACDTSQAVSLGTLGAVDSTGESSGVSESNENKLSCYKSFRTSLNDLDVLFEYTMRNGLSPREPGCDDDDDNNSYNADVEGASTLSTRFRSSDRNANCSYYRRSRSTPFKALVYEDLQRDDSELLNIISRCSAVVEDQEQSERPASLVDSEELSDIGKADCGVRVNTDPTNIKPQEDEWVAPVGHGPAVTSSDTEPNTKYSSNLVVGEEVVPSKQYDENVVLYVDTSLNFSMDSKNMFPEFENLRLQESRGDERTDDNNNNNSNFNINRDCDFSQISESQTSAYSVTSESSCSTMSSDDLTSSAQSSREPSSEVYCIPTFREHSNRRLSVAGIISTLKSGTMNERDIEKLVGRSETKKAKRELEYQGSAFYDELPSDYFESLSQTACGGDGANNDLSCNGDSTGGSIGNGMDCIDSNRSKSKNCSVRFHDKSQLLVYGPQGGSGGDGDGDGDSKGKGKGSSKKENSASMHNFTNVSLPTSHRRIKGGKVKDKEPLSVRSILKRKENIRSDIELKVAQSCDAVDVRSFLKSFKYYEKIKSDEHERYARIRENQMDRYYSWERSGSWMGKNHR